MSNKNKGFEKFVVIFVVLTGAVFGALAGLIYSKVYFWVAAILGGIGGYLVARLYLCWLAKVSAKRDNKFVIWLLGSLVGVLCGILCTTLVHGIMAGATIILTEKGLTLFTEGEGELIFYIVGAEIIGVVAGLIVGGICSLVYVKRVMGKVDEAIDTA
jgi:hypothetical protein